MKRKEKKRIHFLLQIDRPKENQRKRDEHGRFMGGEEDKQKSKFLVSSQLCKQKNCLSFQPSQRRHEKEQKEKTRKRKVVNFTRKISIEN